MGGRKRGPKRGKRKKKNHDEENGIREGREIRKGKLTEEREGKGRLK